MFRFNYAFPRKQMYWLVQLGAASLFILLSSFSLTADDTPVQIMGGSENIFFAQSNQRIINLNVSMVEEDVNIFLASETFTVDAKFTFFNDGPTASISVGFPKIGYGLIGVYKSLDNFSSFQTWVNQKETGFTELKDLENSVILKFGQKTYKDVLNSLNSGGNVDGKVEERHWLVKEVQFPSKTWTRTRVKYTSPYQRFIDSDMARYRYGTGRPWKGPIGLAKFYIHKDKSIDTWEVRLPEKSIPNRFEKKNENLYFVSFKNLEPEFDEEIEIIKDFAE